MSATENLFFVYSMELNDKLILILAFPKLAFGCSISDGRM